MIDSFSVSFDRLYVLKVSTALGSLKIPSLFSNHH
jgi:hypothetical protein